MADREALVAARLTVLLQVVGFALVTACQLALAGDSLGGLLRLLGKLAGARPVLLGEAGMAVGQLVLLAASAPTMTTTSAVDMPGLYPFDVFNQTVWDGSRNSAGWRKGAA